MALEPIMEIIVWSAMNENNKRSCLVLFILFLIILAAGVTIDCIRS